MKLHGLQMWNDAEGAFVDYDWQAGAQRSGLSAARSDAAGRRGSENRFSLPPDHFATGIVNSAPFSVLSGQRCMIDFCFV